MEITPTRTFMKGQNLSSKKMHLLHSTVRKDLVCLETDASGVVINKSSACEGWNAVPND